jgi:hypothetical protein
MRREDPLQRATPSQRTVGMFEANRSIFGPASRLRRPVFWVVVVPGPQRIQRLPSHVAVVLLCTADSSENGTRVPEQLERSEEHRDTRLSAADGLVEGIREQAIPGQGRQPHHRLSDVDMARSRYQGQDSREHGRLARQGSPAPGRFREPALFRKGCDGGEGLCCLRIRRGRVRVEVEEPLVLTDRPVGVALGVQRVSKAQLRVRLGSPREREGQKDQGNQNVLSSKGSR